MKSLAVIFPGQGSQSVGMLKDIATDYSEVQETFSEASDTLGYDLWQLTSTGPAEVLDQTIHTQPALLTASYAIWRILNKQNTLSPAILAGHSLGEYTALVCANALAFTDAVKLVAARGQYMQEAVPMGQGGLAVIVGLENQIVEEICEKSKQGNEILSAVNFNSPGQVVVGGNIAAVERVLILAKTAGSKLAKLLPVSVPSHCILMKPAAIRLNNLLTEMIIHTPQIPVLNNVDVKIYDSSESIRDGLTRQLYMPVRWVEIVQKFATMGITQMVECGPGKVLTGLCKRIEPTLQIANTADLGNLQNILSAKVENH